jgi:signal transduction histidine kinase
MKNHNKVRQGKSVSEMSSDDFMRAQGQWYDDGFDEISLVKPTSRKPTNNNATIMVVIAIVAILLIGGTITAILLANKKEGTSTISNNDIGTRTLRHSEIVIT